MQLTKVSTLSHQLITHYSDLMFKTKKKVRDHNSQCKRAVWQVVQFDQ